MQNELWINGRIGFLKYLPVLWLSAGFHSAGGSAEPPDSPRACTQPSLYRLFCQCEPTFQARKWCFLLTPYTLMSVTQRCLAITHWSTVLHGYRVEERCWQDAPGQELRALDQVSVFTGCSSFSTLVGIQRRTHLHSAVLYCSTMSDLKIVEL